MINYFEWPTRKLSVTTLRLDVKNPRLIQFGKTPTQPEIIDYLIQHEKVLDLAKSIIQQGYFLNELPIVCKEGDKYVVLEGNRRIAACKIIINPDLIKSKSKRTSFVNALKFFDKSFIKKIEVIISPDRESADIMIVNRHTGGSVVEKWDKTKQDRFIYNRFDAGETIDEMAAKFTMTKADVKDALKRYNVFADILKLDLDDAQKSVLSEENKFNMTNVERVYTSKHGRDFLGIDFNEKGNIIKKLPVTEYKSRLKRIVNEVIAGTINSRTLNTEKEKEAYLNNLLKDSSFDSSIVPDKKYDKEYIDEEKSEQSETETPEEVKKSSTANSNTIPDNKLFSPNLKLNTGIKRIDEIFVELKNLNIKNNPNAVSVLLRSYIDMITYQFMKKDGRIKELLKQENIKFTNDFNKRYESVKSYILTLGVKESKIIEAELHKALKVRSSIKKDFVPSLRYMLDFLSKDVLIEEVKLKAALQSYLSKNDKVDKVIGHNEFNLSVHNEYYTSDKDELKAVWNKLEPLLMYMISDIINVKNDQSTL